MESQCLGSVIQEQKRLVKTLNHRMESTISLHSSQEIGVTTGVHEVTEQQNCPAACPVPFFPGCVMRGVERWPEKAGIKPTVAWWLVQPTVPPKGSDDLLLFLRIVHKYCLLCLIKSNFISIPWVNFVSLLSLHLISLTCIKYVLIVSMHVLNCLSIIPVSKA